MKNKTILLFLITGMLMIHTIGFSQNAGNIPLLKGQFITGDDTAYRASGYDDTQWQQQKLGEVWQSQGHADYHGYAWYRIHVIIPSSLKQQASWKDSLRIYLAHVNDVDETFLNGALVGHIGSFPDEPGGYVSKWPAVREYHIPVTSNSIKWDGENIIAVRVYDGGGTGGLFMGQPYIDMLEKINGLTLQMENQKIVYKKNNAVAQINVTNQYNVLISGALHYSIIDGIKRKPINDKSIPFKLFPFQKKQLNLTMPNRQGITITLDFTETSSKLMGILSETLPYILTPPIAAFPAINCASVTAVGPGHPFIFKIPATGKKPLIYKVEKLPVGLQLNTSNGIITGSLAKRGDYLLQVTVKNNLGVASKTVTIKVGDLLALTPPMGWNSWNCWGTSVSAQKVTRSADALKSTGLINHGWNYINIDDGWQSKERSADGKIQPNEKFADMKSLGDYLHGKGLRFGIYSSPGTHTCGGFLGSYDHEVIDAKTYASWGIDYLKYDLCSYLDSMKNNVSLADHQLPYKIMYDALKQQNRDIVYSLCQYGIKDVWKWGASVNGNLWRTTEDIEDTWPSMLSIGFKQDTLYKYAKPGHWNDPDMLTVGMVGWGENLHPTRLTVDEQYTQVSLWSMLSAPLLIGCDINCMDEFTKSLLINDEVIAIDQDISGRQAKRKIDKDSIQVWVKEMADGTRVAAIFNMSDSFKDYRLSFTDIDMPGSYYLRDIWRRKNLPGYKKSVSEILSPHGVFLIKLKAR